MRVGKEGEEEEEGEEEKDEEKKEKEEKEQAEMENEEEEEQSHLHIWSVHTSSSDLQATKRSAISHFQPLMSQCEPEAFISRFV
ncbi:hypothetical protein KOW79_021108 [Hemibagrus wyckioides]|uniref:Uncharacterized protein n=1 Tax=Hemibagrus wyckioides TaxID=337641 RepID=A0A9D3S970_9TELE|nr:hypothetical protein KOW79_021108 [Hemibagrus wyckioides]